MMIYRLLAMNIDGTVLQSNGKVDKTVKDAVEFAREKGIIVTLVTGRNFSFSKKIARTLSIPSLLITHHGAFIASSVDQAIFVKRLDEEMIEDLLLFLEALSAQIRVIHEKITVSNERTKGNLRSRTMLDLTDFGMYQHRFVENISQFVVDEQIHPTHIEVLLSSEPEAEEVKKAIHGMFEVNVHQYKNKLVILPEGVSKLNGFLYACDYWNISLKECVMIGSGMDDLEMIRSAGLGVAMGNAPEEVREEADWVTRSNNDKGVHYMVYEHFRKQYPLDFIQQISTKLNKS